MSHWKQILTAMLFIAVLAGLIGCGANNRDDVEVFILPPLAAIEQGQANIFAVLVANTAAQEVIWETVPPNPWDPAEVDAQPPGTIVPHPGVYLDGDYLPPGNYIAPDAVPYPGTTQIRATSVFSPHKLAYATIYVAMKLDGDLSIDLDSDIEGLTAAGDLLWRQISDTDRQLEPVNGAQMVAMGGMGLTDFHALAETDLTGLTYAFDPIDGGDDSTDLALGTVIAVLTNEGHYAKVQVFGYEAEGANGGFYLKLVVYTFD